MANHSTTSSAFSFFFFYTAVGASFKTLEVLSILSAAKRHFIQEICTSFDTVRKIQDADEPSTVKDLTTSKRHGSSSTSTLATFRATCISTDNSASEWINGITQTDNAPIKTFFRASSDVITASRHLLPRNLTQQPRCESRSGRIVGKHVGALTRSESMMVNDGEYPTLTTSLTSTTDDRDEYQGGCHIPIGKVERRSLQPRPFDTNHRYASSGFSQYQQHESAQVSRNSFSIAALSHNHLSTVSSSVMLMLAFLTTSKVTVSVGYIRQLSFGQLETSTRSMCSTVSTALSYSLAGTSTRHFRRWSASRLEDDSCAVITRMDSMSKLSRHKSSGYSCAIGMARVGAEYLPSHTGYSSSSHV